MYRLRGVLLPDERDVELFVGAAGVLVEDLPGAETRPVTRPQTHAHRRADLTAPPWRGR